MEEGTDSDDDPPNESAERHRETAESEDIENQAEDVEWDSDEEDGLNESAERRQRGRIWKIKLMLRYLKGKKMIF